VALTPAIRDFLVRLDELLETHGTQSQPDVTAIDTAAFLRLGDVELEVDDRVVLVRYRPEEIKFTSRDEALQFIQMIADDRVELEVQRSLLWTTMRSYRDGQPVPFRRTRMPWPTLHPRTERRRIALVN
jgi:hypothetical protein